MFVVAHIGIKKPFMDTQGITKSPYLWGVEKS